MRPHRHARPRRSDGAGRSWWLSNPGCRQWMAAPYWLVIRNDGMALERNVRVLLDGKPIIEHTLVSDDEEEITTIGAGTEHWYILAVSLQLARILDVAASLKRKSWRRRGVGA